jgi:hypothetical protein
LLCTPSEACCPNSESLQSVISTNFCEQEKTLYKNNARLPEEGGDASSTTLLTIIDPTLFGNIGRYLNHSCDPNIHVLPVRINSLVPRAAMFALRNIQAGEELVYDYGSSSTQHASMCDRSNSSAETNMTLSTAEVNDNIRERNYPEEISVGEKLINLKETKIILKPENTSGNSLGRLLKLTGVNAPPGRSEPFTQKRKTVEENDTLKKQRVNFTPCLCGASNCRGFLPSQTELF